jgi:oligopeptide transport system substrate-binding protein
MIQKGEGMSVYRGFTALMVAAALLGALAGGWGPSPAAGQAAGVFRTPLGGEPPTIDPYFATDFSSGDLTLLMYNTLVGFDGAGRLVPEAAKSWDVSPNGLVYTFHLRDNVYFHSGRKVTAADWKWSFERMGDPAVKTEVGDVVVGGVAGYDAQQSGGGGLAGIKVVDPLTLQIVLNPNSRGGFLNRLAYYAAVVLDRDVVERGGKSWFAAHDAGSGPFTMREWAHNDHVSMARDPRYFLGAPKISGVEMPVVTQAQTRLSEYQAGQLDLVAVPLADFQRIKSDAVMGKELLVFPRAQIIWLGPNPRVYEPFKDARVRRAFALAIDKAKIARTVFFGFYQPAASIVPPGIPGFYSGYKGLPYNPAQAKKLLDEAGMTGKLPPLTMAINPIAGDYQMAAEATAAMLKENLGVDVRLQRAEFASFQQGMNRRTVFASFMTGWAADYLDYSDYLDLLLYSKSPLDRVSYANPEFDRLVDQANAAATDAARTALYHKAEALAVEEGAMIPMVFTQFALLKKPYVQGLQTTGALSGYLKFNTVSIQK